MATNTFSENRIVPNRISNRPCHYPMCPHLTSHVSGYCEQHLPIYNRQIDANRGTATERGYTYEWTQYSIRYRHAHPLCVMCQAEGRVTAATCVDHIKPVSGPDDPLFWVESNHQSLCDSCHSKKTATSDQGFGNRPTTG